MKNKDNNISRRSALKYKSKNLIVPPANHLYPHIKHHPKNFLYIFFEEIAFYLSG